MAGRHAALASPTDEIRHRGRVVPDSNGEPSCQTCGWAPGPEDVRAHRESERTTISRIGAMTVIVKLHPYPGNHTAMIHEFVSNHYPQAPTALAASPEGTS